MKALTTNLSDQKGFTIIELVMVIVIIGILAATAIPKFVDLKSNADTAVLDGIGGSLHATVSMKHAQYLINSASTYDAAAIAAAVDVSGATVTEAAGTITAKVTSSGTTRAYVVSGTLASSAPLVITP